MAPIAQRDVERVVGRYALYGEIASGGMATVHFGRLLGPVGFSRTVAVKRLHPQFAKDPEFVSMFLDEARLAARIRHPNAVSTLDVVALEGELFLVMDYVQGETLSRLLRTLRAANEPLPIVLASSILCGVLHGLHAAHEAKSERGTPLDIVHRDVSPQNVMVGVDGVVRVLDFGVAKAAGRVHTTREGQIKGKLAYMAPEQLRGDAIDRRVDVYAASVVLWESLAGRGLFRADNDGAVFGQVMTGATQPPSRFRPEIPAAVDALVMRGLALDPADRFRTAREMAVALEETVGLASTRQVGEWVEGVAGESLAKRAARIKEIESGSSSQRIVAEARPSSRTRPEPGPSSSGPARPTEAISQVSSISVSRPEPASDGGRSWGIIAAIAAGVLVLLGVGFFALRGGDAGAPSPSATPAVAASTAATPPIAAPTATVEASPAPSPPPPTTTPSPAPTTSPVATSVVRAPPRAKPPATPPRPSKANCNPPFSVGADGIKRAKPECI